jgi:hypothetical protein
MTADIKALRPGGKINKEALIQLGSDPNLDRFMIVCFWEDGDATVGWSHDLTNGQLCYGSALVENEIDKCIFPHRHKEEDIIY